MLKFVYRKKKEKNRGMKISAVINSMKQLVRGEKVKGVIENIVQDGIELHSCPISTPEFLTFQTAVRSATIVSPRLSAARLKRALSSA